LPRARYPAVTHLEFGREDWRRAADRLAKLIERR
jgi:hypothetical protein